MNQSDEHLPTGSNGEQDDAGTGWERTAGWGLAMAFAAGLLVSALLTLWPAHLFPDMLQVVGVIIHISLLLTAVGLIFQSARLAFRTPNPGLVGALMLLTFVSGAALVYLIGRAA